MKGWALNIERLGYMREMEVECLSSRRECLVDGGYFNYYLSSAGVRILGIQQWSCSMASPPGDFLRHRFHASVASCSSLLSV